MENESITVFGDRPKPRNPTSDSLPLCWKALPCPYGIDKDSDVLVSALATAFLDAHEGKLHGHAHQFKTTIGYLVAVLWGTARE